MWNLMCRFALAGLPAWDSVDHVLMHQKLNVHRELLQLKIEPTCQVAISVRFQLKLFL